MGSDESPWFYAQCGLNPRPDWSTALTLKVSERLLAGGPFEIQQEAQTFLDARHARCPNDHSVLELYGYTASGATASRDYTPTAPESSCL